MKTIDEYREFLKGDLWSGFEAMETDQKKGIPAPPVQKPHPEGSVLVDLVPTDCFDFGEVDLAEIIAARKSCRSFIDQAMSLKELSFLLWATQGIYPGRSGKRTVPSAGARHPFETYLLINFVDGLDNGLYRYLPLEHKLLAMALGGSFMEKSSRAIGGGFLMNGNALFIWTAIPYRTEWRYGIIAHKMIALDAGHVCQNLYLACSAIGAGTCAIGAYNHQAVDKVIGVDGKDEFAVYLAPVGKINKG